MSDRSIAIIGYYETKIELKSGRHVYDLAGEAMAGAIAHAGIDKSEINGFAVSSCFSDAGNPFYGPVLASYLGLELDWCQITDLGGASASGSPVVPSAPAGLAADVGLAATPETAAAAAGRNTSGFSGASAGLPPDEEPSAADGREPAALADSRSSLDGLRGSARA